MPMAEYMAWQRYDAVEPLSVTAALDRLFSRLMFVTAGNKKAHPNDFMTFDVEPEQKRIERGLERAQAAFEAIAQKDKKRASHGL